MPEQLLVPIRRTLKMLRIALVAMLVVAPIMLVVVYSSALRHGCTGQNEVRREIITFVDGTLSRSTRSLRAVLDSKTATAQQKAVALENQRQLQHIVNDEHRDLAPRSCGISL